MNSGLLHLSNKVAPFNLRHSIREVWLKANNARRETRMGAGGTRAKGTLICDALLLLLIVASVVNGVH